jgi:hypothetical protein
MSPNEGRPGGGVLTLRRRRYAVTTQNIAYCLIRNLVPQIGERPNDPVMAPGRILLGYANNQLLNISGNRRSTRGSTSR